MYVCYDSIEVKFPKSPKAALSRMLKLYSSSRHWTQGAFARRSRKSDPDGVDILSPKAHCFCLSGAITRVCGDGGDDKSINMRYRVRRLLNKAIDKFMDSDNMDIVTFNDAKGRKFKEVVAVVRLAKKLAA